MKLWLGTALLAACVAAGVYAHSVAPPGSLPYYTGPPPSQEVSPPNPFVNFPIKVMHQTLENGLGLVSIDPDGYVNFMVMPLPLAPLGYVEDARVNLIFYDAHGDPCKYLTQPLGTLHGGGYTAGGRLGPIPPQAFRGELSFYGVFLGNAAR